MYLLNKFRLKCKRQQWENEDLIKMREQVTFKGTFFVSLKVNVGKKIVVRGSPACNKCLKNHRLQFTKGTLT